MTIIEYLNSLIVATAIGGIAVLGTTLYLSIHILVGRLFRDDISKQKKVLSKLFTIGAALLIICLLIVMLRLIILGR